MDKPEALPRPGPPARHDSSPLPSSNDPSPPSNTSPSSTAPGRKRSGSGSSILSKFPFMRTAESRSNLREVRESSGPDAADDNNHNNSNGNYNGKDSNKSSPRSISLQQEHQQQKTRKRKGSLRKVALLGRGAAREKRDVKPLVVDTSNTNVARGIPVLSGGVDDAHLPQPQQKQQHPLQNGILVASPESDHGQGLGISGVSSRPSMDGYPSGDGSVPAFVVSHNSNSSKDSLESGKNSNGTNEKNNNNEPQVTSPANTHGSTTDDDDVLSIPPVRGPPSLQSPSLSSISDSYFPRLHHHHHGTSTSSLQRRRSGNKQPQHQKSPLSLQGALAAAASASPLPATVADEDHDYSETEWWGWVILAITWFVFVIGMGSCLNIWSWAWDVGGGGAAAGTSYAPPELEDDPTLPIVGYYPALIILTCVMAWVWVVVAWVGMKYFRHAKISSVD